ncbi:MAG: peptidase [Bacteroidales bacterium]|nr:peptidase [Bacteroidales bacterium]
MKKFLTLLLTLAVVIASAQRLQEPQAVTDRWFYPPDVRIDNPAFNRDVIAWTTYEEMMLFLNDRVSEHPELISMKTIGQTAEGRDIPLIVVSRNDGNEDKLRVLYMGRVHGNEPSGTEGLLHFIRQLAEDEEVNALLNRIDFFIVPMTNIDGGEINTRRTVVQDIDLNRDMTKLCTPEAVAIHAAANIAQPHIVVDFHEYGPIRALNRRIYPGRPALAAAEDMQFLVSGNPNVAQSIRNVIQELFLPNLRESMDANSLTHYNYYTVSEDGQGGLLFNIGGFSPRSSSNAMSLRNSIALLTETRNLGTTSALRRSFAQYVFAVCVARTAYNNEDLVRQVLADGLADRSDVALRFTHPIYENHPLLFIDMDKNDTISIGVRARRSYLPPIVTVSTPLPRYYYLLPSETRALEVLTQLGIETTILQEPRTATVVYHIVTSITPEDPVGGIIPLATTTRTNTREVTFPVGTIKVCTNQRHFRLASVVLEPEMSQGFVNYLVITAVLGQELPLYKEL